MKTKINLVLGIAITLILGITAFGQGKLITNKKIKPALNNNSNATQQNSGGYNACCPPSKSMDVPSMLRYHFSGSVNSPFLVKFYPTYQFKKQMKTYIKYVNSVNPQIHTIAMNWKFKKHATNGDSPGQAISPFLQSEFIYWNIYGNSYEPTGIGAQNIFHTLPFEPGVWYSIHIGTYLAPNDPTFFSKEDCNYRVVYLMIPKVKSSEMKVKITDRPGGKVETIDVKKQQLKEAATTKEKRQLRRKN